MLEDVFEIAIRIVPVELGRLDKFTMTGTSTSRNDTLALHRTVPTQSPIALLRETASVRLHHPRLGVHQRCAFRPIATPTRWSTRPIVIFHINATTQIAIAHRLC
jgi:hypothetical protein